MEIVKIENLTFKYPSGGKPALKNLSLTINSGEFVTVCGKSGCGKSTLLRQLKPLISPHGERTGGVFFCGKDLFAMSQKEQSEKIGFILQNPDNQIVTDKVFRELAFGLESLGLSSQEIRGRVGEIASFFGLQSWFDKKTSELSGGQKQLLNLASVMAMQPQIIILDEPTSQLDPIAASEFLNMLHKINRELGVTIILSEHRLEEVFAISDRVIVLENGEISAIGTPREVGKILKDIGSDMIAALPTPMYVYFSSEKGENCPITVRDGRLWFAETEVNTNILFEEKRDVENNPVIKMRDVWFRYEKDLPDVIKGLFLSVNKGEIYAITGGNGTGKTTSLLIMSSILKAYRGDISVSGKIAMLPQNPQSVFIENTVMADLCASVQVGPDKEKMLSDVISLCELNGITDMHPYDLSGGEQQRAALAKVLLSAPDILLLDEPTKGLDAHFKIKLGELLTRLAKSGITIVLVSHDIEFCAKYADRCGMFFDGNIISEDKTRPFFSGKSFYTTAANRMAREKLPTAILPEDIILSCGGSILPNHEKKVPDMTEKPEKNESVKRVDVPKADSVKDNFSIKNFFTALFIFLITIPITILAGNFYLGVKKYFIISLLIILQTMIPFVLGFEKRKPKAREIVIISVLCGIAVAGRIAFSALPQFKPLLAVVIISAIAFGGETGFLVGLMSIFVSNFFLAQGMWTPWQMFAAGIIGFIAGNLFKFIKKSRLLICLFGGISTLFIYGGIMNSASVIIYQPKPTIEMFLSAYALGFPMDIIHALSTAFFLWIAAPKMLEKLNRVKEKYGLVK